MTRLRLLSVAGGVLLGLLVATSAVQAANEVPTRLSIGPLAPIVIGDSVTVVVALALDGGAPLVDMPISLTIDGGSLRRLRTDVAGVATFRLSRDMAPGDYALVASYAGQADAYLAASAQATLTIVPFELAVVTVPPLPGMVFELDDTRFIAGEDGVARIAVALAGDHELGVIEDEYRNPNQLVVFSRWNTEVFGPRIPIRVPYRHAIQAGFDVSYRASQTFVDPEGGVVDPARVTSMTLRSSLGTVLTYSDWRARWYKASRTVRRPTGLQQVPVRYTLDSVIVDGANVVNHGQERFDITPDAMWEIELLLFSAHLLPNDALFGFPIGDAVTVTYPDGRQVRIKAEANGELWARWLARGQYRVTVANAPGWAPVMPVALSRDQDVELRVISYLDMAAVLFAAAGLAFGLLHLGRPHLLPKAVGVAGGGVAVLVRRRVGLLRARGQVVSHPDPATTAGNHGGVGGSAMPSRAQRTPLLPSLLPVQTVVVRRPDVGTAPADAPSAPPAAIGDATPAATVDALEAPPSSVASPPTSSPKAARSSRSRAKDRPVQGTALTAPRRTKATWTAAQPAATPSAASTPQAATATPRKARRSKKATVTSSEQPVRPAVRRKAPSSRAAPTASDGGAAKTSRAGKSRTKAGRPALARGKAKPAARAAGAKKSNASLRSKAATPRLPGGPKGPVAAAVPTPAPTAPATRTAGGRSVPLTSTANVPKQAAVRRSGKTNGRAATPTKAKRGSRTAAGARTARKPSIGSASSPSSRRSLVPVPMTLSQERAVLDQRRRQLASLGLDDPDQTAASSLDNPGSVVDPVVGGAAPTEIAICAGCGLTLWVGARFCRRCGRVQEPSQAVAPIPAVAGSARGKRARRGAVS